MKKKSFEQVSFPAISGPYSLQFQVLTANIVNKSYGTRSSVLFPKILVL